MVLRWAAGQAQIGGIFCVSFLVVFCILAFDATDHYFYCLCQIVAST